MLLPTDLSRACRITHILCGSRDASRTPLPYLGNKEKAKTPSTRKHSRKARPELHSGVQCWVCNSKTQPQAENRCLREPSKHWAEICTTAGQTNIPACSTASLTAGLLPQLSFIYLLISSSWVSPKLSPWLPDAGRVGDGMCGIDRGWSISTVTGQIKKFWVLLHSRVMKDNNNILYASKNQTILHQEMDRGVRDLAQW